MSKDPNAGKVFVRVLSEVYGSTKDPIARKGETIWVDKAEYERLKGTPSMIDGKIKGATFRLVDDEKKVAQQKAEDQAARQATHDARKAQFKDQYEASKSAMLLRAKQDMEEAQRNYEALEAKSRLETSKAQKPEGK